MKTKEYITAEWARANATNNLGPALTNDLNAILDGIDESVRNNLYFCRFSFELDERVKSNLESRGFKVISYYGKDNEPIHLIKW